MKKTAVLAAVLLLALASILAGCATGQSYPVKIKFDIAKKYVLHTDIQSGYMQDKDVKNIRAYADGTEERSMPEPVEFSWTATGDATPSSYIVTLYEDKEMTVVGRRIESTSTYARIYNLKVGTTYYVTVEALLDGETVGLGTASFKTDPELPRNLYIEGVANCRDVGGWKTEDGGTVRQGLLYRTAKLNKNYMVKVSSLINSNTVNTMVGELGIKTELDLRNEDSNETGSLNGVSLLGDSVKYVNCTMMSTFPIIQKNSYEGICEVFDVLADEDNYPIFYHCSIGTDRTGAISFFVLNLCGVSEEDIYRDYLFSNFGNIGSNRLYSQCKVYFDTIKPFEGDTWTEKTRSFLLSIGVTDEEMDSVVRIMKEAK